MSRQPCGGQNGDVGSDWRMPKAPFVSDADADRVVGRRRRPANVAH